MRSLCPTCRSSFAIGIHVPSSVNAYAYTPPAVAPDPRFIPQMYREFIKPSIQRVYVTMPSHSSLITEIKQARERLEKIERDHTELIFKSELREQEARRYAEGEKRARKEVSRLKKQVDILQSQSRLGEMMSEVLQMCVPVLCPTLTR